MIHTKLYRVYRYMTHEDVLMYRSYWSLIGLVYSARTARYIVVRRTLIPWILCILLVTLGLIFTT